MMARARRGLAGAQLADDAEGLAGADRDDGVVDRLDVADGAAEQAAADREPDAQVLGLDDRRGVGGGGVGGAGRLGGEQLAGVGMLRASAKRRGGGAGLDDLALLHHRDAVGDAADDAEVVGDEQHRHALGLLHLGEQVEDAGLDGDVEGGGRLVGDQDVGAVGERHRDHHPLALAAGELVRVGAEALLGVADADAGQEVEDAGAGRGAGQALVQREALGDLRSMVCSGLRLVIGSWKMKLMSLPRVRRRVRSSAVSISVPR